MKTRVLGKLRECVEAGGGIWSGIWFVPANLSKTGKAYFLVMFDSPETRTTLALKAREVTVEAVRQRVQHANGKAL